MEYTQLNQLWNIYFIIILIAINIPDMVQHTDSWLRATIQRNETEFGSHECTEVTSV